VIGKALEEKKVLLWSIPRPIPRADSAKYLGMHLDSRLNWKQYVRQKKFRYKKIFENFIG